MYWIKRVGIFLLVGILFFYVGYCLLKGTHSVSEYNLEFSATLNIDKTNKFIKYLPVGTTISELLNRLIITGDDADIVVSDSLGNIKKDSDLIASGDVLTTYIGNTKMDEYILSVNGDSNGDGILNMIDVILWRRHYVDWVDPDTNEVQKRTGVYSVALDFNKDGTIDMIDIVLMRRVIVGLAQDEYEQVEDKISYTAKFYKNGATEVGSSSLSCTSFATNKCEIITPSISDDGIVIGWSTNKNSKIADVLVNAKVELTDDVTYYAITKKTYTVTFDNTGLDYLESSSLSCDVYNTDSSCNIILPVYNKKGHFNSFWSPYKEASSDLGNTTWSWKYFNQVGRDYELTSNVTLYPNFNHFHYDLTTYNFYKYRTINVLSSIEVGETLFEFENGIPQTIIDKFIYEMNIAYNKIPWLFTSGKVFVMTEETYNDYSIAYGLTHQMYVSYGGDSYFTIDLNYDVSANAISVNAALHELAHAWDSYYYFNTGVERISKLDDFDTFYNSITSKLYVDSEGNKISKVETFAGMFTNYYWHVLGVDDTKEYYALKSGVALSTSELSNLKTFMEKYINFAKNGY